MFRFYFLFVLSFQSFSTVSVLPGSSRTGRASPFHTRSEDSNHPTPSETPDKPPLPPPKPATPMPGFARPGITTSTAVTSTNSQHRNNPSSWRYTDLGPGSSGVPSSTTYTAAGTAPTLVSCFSIPLHWTFVSDMRMSCCSTL